MSLKSSLMNLVLTLITACVLGTLIGMNVSSRIDFETTHRFPPVSSGSKATDLAGLDGEYDRGNGRGLRNPTVIKVIVVHAGKCDHSQSGDNA